MISILDDLVKNNTIDFWCFIRHEPDEESKKDHVHLYVDPAKTIETTSLKDKFIQIVPGEALPRRNLNFRYSKFDDWYLYSLHQKDYLNEKGLYRNKEYSKEDFHFSDLDEFERYVSEINYSSIFNLDEIINAARIQMPIYQAIKDGILPAKNNKLLNLYKSIKYDSRPYENNLDKKYKGV